MFDLWSSDPTLVPGFGYLEAWDAGWLHCLTDRQESTRAPFPTGGTIIDIPDKATMCLAGDWGTGQAPATTNVASLMVSEKPDYTIHLGDVYYSGRSEEEGRFAGDWPAGALGSFNLPGNHDLYSGGWGYLQTLADDKFSAQGGKSYFALRNKNWLIFGLDSASAAPDFMYKSGMLGAEQLAWMNQLRSESPRRTVFLTHHDGFNLDVLEEEGGGTTIIRHKPLWNQIAMGPTDIYYFGHLHYPVVYSNGCRCIGHGGVPYKILIDDPAKYGSDGISVEYAETQTIAGTNRGRAGFAVLRLDGATITEQLVAEDGTAVWQG